MVEFVLSFSDRAPIDDELYGKIYLTKVEDELSKTGEFRRLGDIVQLGTARYIYQSARHTRASHCFGTMYLTDRIVRWLAERLERKYGVIIKNSDLQNFRIAALLHDLGHGPFSHSIESVLERNPNFRPEVRALNGKKQAIRHEDFTIDLLLKPDSEISQVLTYHNIDSKEIALLISGEYKDKLRYFGQLLSSDVDVDRIDYVLRDMYHIGMGWKEIIDLNSLIYAFDTDFSPYYASYILYIDESQMANIDLFLHLRSIFIFSVPLNRKVHCSDFMLTRALEHALAKENDPAQKVYEIFTKMRDNDLLNYLKISDDRSKRLLERLEKGDFYKSFEFKVRNLEPESRYNFFKISKEFGLHRNFENKIKELLVHRATLDKRTLGEFDLVVDFNFPEAFPLKLFIRTNVGDYHLYFDYSPLIRGIAKNMFEESVVLIFYDNEIVGKYLELISNAIIEDVLKKISNLASFQDTDKILLVFSVIDDLGRRNFKIDDLEWTGPYLKGWRRLNDIILFLKENGIDFSYKFAFKAGKTKYDEELWRDVLRLVACGLIYERLTPAVITRETGRAYRERNDFQMTPFGRRYVTKYLGQNKEWLMMVRKLIEEEWERTKSKLEIIRDKQRMEECLEHAMANEGLDTQERLKIQRKLQELIKEIRDMKEDILLMIDYREDIY